MFEDKMLVKKTSKLTVQLRFVQQRQQYYNITP